MVKMNAIWQESRMNFKSKKIWSLILISGVFIVVLVVYTSSKATALKQAERMTTVSDSIQNKPANNGDANNGDFDKADLVPCRDDPYVSFEIHVAAFKVNIARNIKFIEK